MDSSSMDTEVLPPGGAPVSFPRLSARTLRFTLGEPRNVTVTADGARVLFVRTRSGTDRTGMLWCYDVARRAERILADPRRTAGRRRRRPHARGARPPGAGKGGGRRDRRLFGRRLRYDRVVRAVRSGMGVRRVRRAVLGTAHRRFGDRPAPRPHRPPDRLCRSRFAAGRRSGRGRRPGAGRARDTDRRVGSGGVRGGRGDGPLPRILVGPGRRIRACAALRRGGRRNLLCG